MYIYHEKLYNTTYNVWTDDSMWSKYSAQLQAPSTISGGTSTGDCQALLCWCEWRFELEFRVVSRVWVQVAGTIWIGL